jgi:hypothetical protein
VNPGQVANSQWRLAEEAHSVHIHFALGDLDPLYIIHYIKVNQFNLLHIDFNTVDELFILSPVQSMFDTFAFFFCLDRFTRLVILHILFILPGGYRLPAPVIVLPVVTA